MKYLILACALSSCADYIYGVTLAPTDSSSQMFLFESEQDKVSDKLLLAINGMDSSFLNTFSFDYNTVEELEVKVQGAITQMQKHELEFLNREIATLQEAQDVVAFNERLRNMYQLLWASDVERIMRESEVADMASMLFGHTLSAKKFAQKDMCFENVLIPRILEELAQYYDNNLLPKAPEMPENGVSNLVKALNRAIANQMMIFAKVHALIQVHGEEKIGKLALIQIHEAAVDQPERFAGKIRSFNVKLPKEARYLENIYFSHSMDRMTKLEVVGKIKQAMGSGYRGVNNACAEHIATCLNFSLTVLFMLYDNWGQVDDIDLFLARNEDVCAAQAWYEIGAAQLDQISAFERNKDSLQYKKFLALGAIAQVLSKHIDISSLRALVDSENGVLAESAALVAPDLSNNLALSFSQGMQDGQNQELLAYHKLAMIYHYAKDEMLKDVLEDLIYITVYGYNDMRKVRMKFREKKGEVTKFIFQHFMENDSVEKTVFDIRTYEADKVLHVNMLDGQIAAQVDVTSEMADAVDKLEEYINAIACSRKVMQAAVR